MLIRPALAAELTAVGALTLAAYVADGYTDPDGPYAGELRAAADRAAEAELVVAVDDADALLGTVTFALPGSPWSEIARPDEGEFRMLAVAGHARGRGVGSALARWSVERSRSHGCSTVALSSLTGMHAAHRIYERMGFIRDPDRDWEPAPGVSLVAYVLDLGAASMR